MKKKSNQIRFSGTRRPSQISALSTAYTVKSLPGAMLYIPVENDYNTPVSLKRSLSDPEIYFPSAVRHSLIVAVNGIAPHDKLSSSASSTPRGIGDIGRDSKEIFGKLDPLFPKMPTRMRATLLVASF